MRCTRYRRYFSMKIALAKLCPRETQTQHPQSLTRCYSDPTDRDRFSRKRSKRNNEARHSTNKTARQRRMDDYRDPRLADAYLRRANAFGEWKSTEGFADPILDLLSTPLLAMGSTTGNPRASKPPMPCLFRKRYHPITT